MAYSNRFLLIYARACNFGSAGARRQTDIFILTLTRSQYLNFKTLC